MDQEHDAGQDFNAGTNQDRGFRARCLLRGARWATLATAHAGAEAGVQPFASLVTHAVAPDGALLMLLSSLAEHTRHLAAAPRCALMAVGAPVTANWQTAPRVTVTGEARPEPDPALRAAWLAQHAYARMYADFTDFSLWRIIPEQALYIGGFALAVTLTAADMAPPADAVASVAAVSAALVDTCNGTHREALSRLAHAAGAGGDWKLLGLDTDGFDLAQDDAVLRLAFDMPMADGAAAREELLRRVGAARHW